ncbi:hypothetical protein O0I10_004371 [Lichtheimia ornata]|uniref:polynucleotide adenylyltransferase n=1 Tax=Lichtheimia ornata TaxID=688661 RepID=A0AAD7V5K4_9FUNG|nr:uncharacterized protein O0I10_004371 [Lichtheimia ornata]KAJ8659778.1 hypothetical protein O0I10_004371 [Lichtheimia ornata]
MDTVEKQPQDLNATMMRCPTTSTTSSPQSEDDNDNTSDSISTEVLSAQSCDSFCTTQQYPSSENNSIDHSSVTFEPIVLDRIFEDNLSVEMLSLYEELLPTRESHDRRSRLISKIERLLNTEWPDRDIRVHLFGSSVNDLGTSQSDVDLCITTPWNGLRNVRVLAKLFKRCGMQHVVCVPRAKVPIVRLFDPETQLACDINVNNTLALQNTKMIKTYVALDPRVRPLIMILKHWTKQRRLNDAANGGTLSTYTWTCMTLNFLQMRHNSILPVLHQLVGNKDDDSFCTDVERLRGYGEDNHESLGGLLYAFFRHFAVEFDYANQVVSVRHGRYLSKEEKAWDVGRNKFSLCVEEPFNVSRNLGNSADQQSVRGLTVEFRRACHLLAAGASLDLVCLPYISPGEEQALEMEMPSSPSPTSPPLPQQPAIIQSNGVNTTRPIILPIHPMDNAAISPTLHDDNSYTSSSTSISTTNLIPSIPAYDIRYMDTHHNNIIPHRPRFNSAIVSPSTNHNHSSYSRRTSTTRIARHGSHPVTCCTATTGGPTPIAITIALPPPSSYATSTRHHRVVPVQDMHTTVDSIFARYCNNMEDHRRSSNHHRRNSLARRRSSNSEWPTISPTTSSNSNWETTGSRQQQQQPQRRRRWSTVKKVSDDQQQQQQAQLPPSQPTRRTMADVVKTTRNNKNDGCHANQTRHPVKSKSEAASNGNPRSSSGNGSGRQRRRNKQQHHHHR